MKRNFKQEKVKTGVITGVVVGVLALMLGGLIGVANESGWEHALGQDREAGEQVVLSVANVSEATPVVNENEVKVKGHFLAGEESTQFTYTLDVDGTDDFDTTNVSLNQTFENVEKLTLTIDGYDGLIGSVDLTMLASEKNCVEAKVYTAGLSIGNEKIGVNEDTYTYESAFLRDGILKIIITNNDPEVTFKLSEIVINPLDEEAE